jgi:hypothetical protein
MRYEEPVDSSSFLTPPADHSGAKYTAHRGGVTTSFSGEQDQHLVNPLRETLSFRAVREGPAPHFETVAKLNPRSCEWSSGLASELVRIGHRRWAAQAVRTDGGRKRRPGQWKVSSRPLDRIVVSLPGSGRRYIRRQRPNRCSRWQGHHKRPFCRAGNIRAGRNSRRQRLDHVQEDHSQR